MRLYSESESDLGVQHITAKLSKSSESVGGQAVQSTYRFFTPSRVFINLLSANLPSSPLRLPVTRLRDLSSGNEIK